MRPTAAAAVPTRRGAPAGRGTDRVGGCGLATPLPRPRRFARGHRTWRRRWESNPRIRVLQTRALPLGYVAVCLAGEGICRGVRAAVLHSAPHRCSGYGRRGVAGPPSSRRRSGASDGADRSDFRSGPSTTWRRPSSWVLRPLAACFAQFAAVRSGRGPPASRRGGSRLRPCSSTMPHRAVRGRTRLSHTPCPGGSGSARADPGGAKAARSRGQSSLTIAIQRGRPSPDWLRVGPRSVWCTRRQGV